MTQKELMGEIRNERRPQLNELIESASDKVKGPR